MKPAILPLLLAATLSLVLTPTARARIGETEAEITARYGDGKKDTSDYQGLHSIDPSVVRAYAKDGIRIQVGFAGGKSVCESYAKADGSGFTDSEIAALMDANKGESSWMPIGSDPKSASFYRRDLLLSCTYDRTTHVFDIRQDHPPKPDKPMNGF